MEFVILMTFMMLIFAGTFVAIQYKTIDIENDQIERQVNALGNVIKNEVQLAYTVHDGYKKTFWIPDYIDGYDYTIALIDESDIRISYKDQYFLVFLIKSFKGSFNHGLNNISKVKGQIYLNCADEEFLANSDFCGALDSEPSCGDWLDNHPCELCCPYWVEQNCADLCH